MHRVWFALGAIQGGHSEIRAIVTPKVGNALNEGFIGCGRFAECQTVGPGKLKGINVGEKKDIRRACSTAASSVVALVGIREGTPLQYGKELHLFFVCRS